jgi:hypothetical protein
VTTSQETVLTILQQHGPLPDHALVPLVQHVAQARMSSSGIRSRRAELVDQGVIEAVDEIKMPSGRMAQVWGVV